MTSVTRSSSGLEEETLTVLRSFSRRIFSWVCRKQRHFNKVISSSDIKCANKRKKKKQEEVCADDSSFPRVYRFCRLLWVLLPAAFG